MKKILMLAVAGCLAQAGAWAQTFSTEFSAEMQKVDGKMEVAPQLKGILELPLGKAWSVEMEVASSQAGLDYRVDAKREIYSAARASSPTLSLMGGASSGDACGVHFLDLGMGAVWEKWEGTAILHYSPFASSHDKYLELTVQRNIGCVYIQPGLYVNHAAREWSLTGVLTVGISLDVR